ncbi:MULTISPECIES: MdtA/MuxA family multidrug efflux RND transporter periplasmic adaptor subunit [Acidovorax]|uniref:Membrane fusion protein, multidrug efflux system n=1 Tax=Acidovorax soli TaxID=592050 RepID=A0A1H4B804_9BURK|nr:MULTISPECIES: MdtA/MuxA family multidrug efflux RND transporter periplasmic adaptor subunit [Acidovorax]SEA44259.1 membrane fusion protein, multidrug efflux system [Acidovorax soli]
MLPHRSHCLPLRSPLHQRGRALWWGLLLIVIALAAGGGWWWKQRNTAADGASVAAGAPAARAPGRFSAGGQVQPVSVGVVRRQDVRVMVQAIGTMSARATAVVRAKVGGELTALHFREGQQVKAGQLLAEIDPRSYQAALGQVQGSLQRDQALLRNAQLDLQRYKDLLAQDSIATQQVDTQAALVRQLEGTVAAGQAQVDAARLQLGYTRITAPIAGRLGLRQADRGNVVGPSDANGIVTINLVQPIDAAFAVPEAHLASITRRLAEGADLPVELWDREQKRRLARGRMSALDNAIDPTTGTIKVKASFANEDGGLFPNQFVNVRLQLDVLPNALTVPGTAVQNNYVYLVQPDGTVTQRRIRVGVADGDRVSVEGELNDGDQVVTDGIDRLREGAKVAVIDAGVAARADEAAQDAGARRAALLRSLTQAERDKLATMSPDERRAFLRARRQQAGGAAPPAAAASAASATVR